MYEVELPDGTIVEVPDNVSEQDAFKRIYKAYPQFASKTRTWGEVATDTGASLTKGLGALVAAPGQLTQLVPGMAGIGEAMQKPGTALQGWAEGLKSEGLKTREALRSKAMSDAEKEGILSEFMTAIGQTIKDPALISSFIAEQLPMLLPGLGAAKLAQLSKAAKVAGAGAGLEGAAAKEAIAAAQAAANKTATRAAVSTGPVLQAADVSSDTYKEAMAELKDRTDLSDKQKQDMALTAARKSAGMAAAFSVGSMMIPGAQAIEKRLAGVPGAGRVKSALGETAQETVEEGGGAFSKNVSMLPIDPERSLTQGIGSAAGLGALGGGVFGAALGTSGPAQNLVEGQREGETLRQAAERTQQELLDLRAMQAEQAAADQQATQQAAQTGISSLLGGVEDKQPQRKAAQSPAEFNNLLAQTAEVAPKDQGIQVLMRAAASNSRSASQSPADFNALLAQTALADTPMDSGIASMLAGPQTRTAPSRVESPASFDTLLAPEIAPQAAPEMAPGMTAVLEAIGQASASRAQSPSVANNLLAATPEPEAPAAPPSIDPGLAEILQAIGSPQASRVKSPSVANNLLATESAPEAPPVATPGLSSILEATGRSARSRAQGPSNVNNLLAPEPQDATTTQEPTPAGEGAEAVVSPTVGEGVPVAGKPPAGATAAGTVAPESGGVALPESDAGRPAGRKRAVPVAVAPIAPERGLLFNSPALTRDQHNVVDSISALPEHAPTLQAINSNLGRLTTFLNSQGESVAGPVQSKNPLVKEAKSIYQSLIKTGAEYSSKALGANQNPTPAATKAVAALQQQVAKETSAQSKPEQFFQKLEQQPKKSLATGAAPVQEEVPSAEEQDVSLNVQIEAKTKQLGNILTKLMSNMGMRDVALKLVANMKAEGEYANQLITLALNVDSPVRVLRHESIHAMKALGFFSEKQWETLRKEADTKWIKQFLGEGKDSRFEQYRELFKEQNLSEADAHEAMIEEAIADAFGQFDVSGAPSGLMSAILKRMQNMFAAIRSAFGGTETAEQILKKVEQGKLQAKAAPSEAGVAKPSLRTGDKRGKWYADATSQQQATLDKWEDERTAGSTSNWEDLDVRPSRENIYDSASGFFNDYEKANGLFDIPLADIGPLTGYDNAKDKARIQSLADQIKENGEIEPVFVAVDPDGESYLMEGQHRSRALELLGYKSVPARVIVSMDEVEQPKASLREKPSLENAWKASAADKKKAAAYAEENGIEPYISEGRLDLPTKFSLKLKEKKGYGMSPLLGIPMNKDGTVTVYYHTTKSKTLDINSKKMIPAEGRNRIYVTNESSGAKILGGRGNFDQELDGSTVLLHLPESLLQIDQEYPDGRKDFFVPIAQGDFFNRKMQAASIQAERTKAITEVFSYKEHEEKIAAAVAEYQGLDKKDKEKRLKQARAILKKEHNVGTLMTENGKLEKTRMGGLLYEGQPIDSMGLGLAAAQQISDKLSTCPNAAICEGLCLGETSGGNLVYGGAAQEDVADIAKSAFRAGPRMMQYLKTEALIIHPEEFAIVLQSEIDSLVKWDQKTTVRKKNPETGVSEQVEKDIYQSAVRLNVTSDFRGEMWRGVIENNPNVMFYDYTKIVGNRPIAENHHLTYSSTGFGQMVDGEKVFFKTKSGNYNHNWTQIRNLLNSGKNSAMAFSSKSSLPEFLYDEETGVTYKVLDGDDYDARFLDEASPLKQDSPYGVIVGLRNKASTLKEKSATKETGGFFANYDPKTDGDTVTVPTQTEFGAPPYKAPGKSIPITKASIRAPQTKEFKTWFADSKIVDENGEPKVMFHGTARDITAFRAKQAGAIFVTDQPGFAETFADTSADWMSKNPEEFFTKEEIAAAKLEAIKEIKASKKGLPITSKNFLDNVIELLRRSAKNMSGIADEAIAYLEGQESVSSDVISYANEELRNQFIGKLPTGQNIMPVFVKAENPFDYENQDDVNAILGELKNFYDYKGNNYATKYGPDIENGNWETIEMETVQTAIKKAGFDGFYVKENGVKNLAVYDPTQIKSAIGNVGTFEPTSPDIRKSLRSTLPPAIVQRIDQTTTAREDKGFIGRMLQAISPGSHTSIRAELLNRYDALSEIDRLRIKQMGGAAAMADIASESAALMSDLGAGITASALGVHDKVGGAPVYAQSFYVVRNGKILPRRYKTKAQAQAVAGTTGEVRSGGHTTVSNFNNAVKGPLAIFAPLAKYNDPMIYQAYQFWAAVKRGKRFDTEGREFLIDAKGPDAAHAAALERRYPEFDSIQQEWIKYNNKLVQYMVDTGVLTPEKGKIYTEHSDYIPFYRQMEGDTIAGPKVFAAISGVKGPKALKGGKAALDDFLETIVRNTQSAIQAGVKNIAAQRAVEAAQDVGLATKLPAGNGLPSTVMVLENGVPTYYDCKDALFVNALKSLAMSDIPFLNILAAPANLLRAAVTKEPTFMLANMLRDSLSAYVTSGVNMTPVIDTAKNFAKTIAGMSPEYEALRKAGIAGGYEFTQGVETSGRNFGEQLKKLAGVKATGVKRLGQLAASPVTGVWSLLEKGSEASDAATRQEIYKKTLAETGNETEALFRSLEVMNFNRKGRNAGIRLFTAMIPFLNARMQGLDILYRSAIRPSLLGQSATAREKELQHTFLVRGATMAGLSAMYWFLTSDDEEYEKQEQETKDNYWLIPSLGIKIPIPFEVGVLFKVIPERIMALAFGDDTFRDFRESMANQVISTLKVNPIPQAFIPLIENLTNYSFYTTRAIVSPGMEDLEPGYQAAPSTSTLIADVGRSLNISPIKLEHAIQGYTGSMGMYLVAAMDAVYDANSTTPRPSKRFEQLPLIKRFALDPEARGSVTAFYKLKDSVDIAVKTSNMLERTGDFDEYEQYTDENINLLASKEYIGQLANDLKDLAEMKAMLRASEESADSKRDALLEIQQMENQLTENIRELREMAYATD